MQGRFHYYEGYPLWKCAMPVRVMRLLGATHLIASNAAGGLNKCYKVGDIMLIKDHINMLGFGGNNPLRGPNESRFGPRFPSMYGVYNKNIIQTAKRCAAEEGWGDMVHEGVYSCVGGPNFETIAELRMLELLGADAVGMSTAHEVIIATHCGMTVLAFSLITDMCITDYETDDDVNHEEVLSVGKKSEKVLKPFVTRIVDSIANQLQSKSC
ncbi:hypothetical protein ILUMI_21364 [Ignelater luminosus]|uniref:purine-nucleoside phosphorylase n=1 Tax=Ignelater luminosus TaxID=2038154 RepID=A0A8K0G3Y2_IGNLU|nr:hypothetical protein ILUMI_21364 [Ignelater luminosus]